MEQVDKDIIKKHFNAKKETKITEYRSRAWRSKDKFKKLFSSSFFPKIRAFNSIRLIAKSIDKRFKEEKERKKKINYYIDNSCNFQIFCA